MMETINHNGIIVEVKKIDVIHDGTCTCWKDCNCSESKGKIRYSYVGYRVVTDITNRYRTKIYDAVQSFIDKRADKITVAMVNRPKALREVKPWEK